MLKAIIFFRYMKDIAFPFGELIYYRFLHHCHFPHHYQILLLPAHAFKFFFFTNHFHFIGSEMKIASGFTDMIPGHLPIMDFPRGGIYLLLKSEKYGKRGVLFPCFGMLGAHIHLYIFWFGEPLLSWIRGGGGYLKISFRVENISRKWDRG